VVDKGNESIQDYTQAKVTLEIITGYIRAFSLTLVCTIDSPRGLVLN